MYIYLRLNYYKNANSMTYKVVVGGDYLNIQLNIFIYIYILYRTGLGGGGGGQHWSRAWDTAGDLSYILAAALFHD